VLCGFSRGAIACNFIGLHDDEIAGLWCGFIAYSHYDGVKRWGFPGSDRESALRRLRRLGERPQLVMHEDPPAKLAETRTYLESTGADLSKAHASRTNFTAANLTGANLTKAEMPRANFSGARLDGADLSKAELGRAILTGASLKGVNLKYANVSRANFSGADLEGVDLTGAYTYLARVEDTDLSGVKGLTQDQLNLTCGNAATKLPPGHDRPADWPCGEDE